LNLHFNLLNKKGEKVRSRILTYENQSLVFTQFLAKKGDSVFCIASYEHNDTSLKGQGRYAKAIYLNNLGDTTRTFNIAYHYLPNGKPGFGYTYPLRNGNFVTNASFNNTVGDSVYMFWNDSNGNIIRVKEYPQLRRFISNIIETPDNGLLLVGFQHREERYIVNADFELIFVGRPDRLWHAKTDSIGNILWQKLLTGAGYELYDTIWFKYKVFNQTRFKDAVQTVNGNYLLTGYIETNPFLCEINEQGEMLWSEKYLTHFHYLDSLKRKASFKDIILKDGYIFILGYMDTLLPNQQVQTIPFLMKLTETGKTVWTRYLMKEEYDYLYFVTACKDGFLLTGSKMDTIPKYGRQDAWLLKLDSNGCLIPGCNLLNGMSENGFPKDEIDFLIYPNPVSTILHIQSSYPHKAFELWNTTGNLAYKGNAETQTIDVSNIAEGLYMLRILGENEQWVVKKISILR
jgi:hypothetical protein